MRPRHFFNHWLRPLNFDQDEITAENKLLDSHTHTTVTDTFYRCASSHHFVWSIQWIISSNVFTYLHKHEWQLGSDLCFVRFCNAVLSGHSNPCFREILFCCAFICLFISIPEQWYGAWWGLVGVVRPQSSGGEAWEDVQANSGSMCEHFLCAHFLCPQRTKFLICLLHVIQRCHQRKW